MALTMYNNKSVNEFNNYLNCCNNYPVLNDIDMASHCFQKNCRYHFFLQNLNKQSHLLLPVTN